MKIIIDEEALRNDLPFDGDYNKAYASHYKACEILGAWTDADEIHYRPCDKGEIYRVIKDSKELIISPLSTPIDGAWISINEEELNNA